MSWASYRRTTRIEDEAYCLLGIFGVHMPLLYGEGNPAFRRLQEEIIKQTEDCSFLFWTTTADWQPREFHDSTPQPVLAESPRQFLRNYIMLQEAGATQSIAFRAGYQEIKLPTEHNQSGPILDCPWAPSRMTSRGLHVSMPLTHLSGNTNAYISRAACSTADDLWILWTNCHFQGRLVGILLGAVALLGGFKRYGRISCLLYLMPVLGRQSFLTELEHNLKPVRSEVYLQTTHDYKPLQRTGSLLDSESSVGTSSLEVVLSPLAQTVVSTASKVDYSFKRCHEIKSAINTSQKGCKRLLFTDNNPQFKSDHNIGFAGREDSDGPVDRIIKHLILLDATFRPWVTLFVRLEENAMEFPQCKLSLGPIPKYPRKLDFATDRDILRLQDGTYLVASLKVHPGTYPDKVPDARLWMVYGIGEWFVVYIDLKLPTDGS